MSISRTDPFTDPFTALYTSTARKGDYFRGEMPFNNSTGALWLTITNVAALSNYTGADIVTNAVGRMFLPKTPEAFSYDLDGNLTNDGRWSYVWDAENRVTRMESSSDAPSPSKCKLEFTYDSKSRRTQKIVSSWNGSAYIAQSTNRFVYDGWNLIAILDATNGLVQSFTWGLDASGSLQGAGGVGGLVSMTVHQGTNAGTYFYCYDGNHNVTTLVNATNGAIAAQYDYASFGELLRATGPLAFSNPFTFSTKFCDWETGFLYYGYRYYDPDTGRWPNRDPMEEMGGWNLYAFVFNEPLAYIDSDGQMPQWIIDFFDDLELSTTLGAGLQAGGGIATKIKKVQGVACCYWEGEFSVKAHVGIGLGPKFDLARRGTKLFTLNLNVSGPRLSTEYKIKVAKLCDGAITGTGRYEILKIHPGYFSASGGADVRIPGFAALSGSASFTANVWGGVVGEVIAGYGGVVLNLNLEGGATAEYFFQLQAHFLGWGIRNKMWQGKLADEKFRKTLATATIHFP